MHWFFIALAAPFLWALVNLADKYLVVKYSSVKHGSGGLVLFSSLVGIFVAIFIGLFTPDLFKISPLDKFLLVLAGGINVALVIFYLFALEIEDVSAVVPWFLTIPIFGYALGYIFLGETLSRQQMIGSLIILLGVLLISIDFSENKRRVKFAVAFYMLVACFLAAIAGVIFKYVTIGNNFWTSSFWEYVGIGIVGLLIYTFVPKYRNEFIVMNEQGGIKIIALNSLSEISTILGNLLTNYAILLAPITMVYLVGSLQPAIVLFLTLIATKFFPNIANENISTKILLPKIISIFIIILGSIILFF